MGRSGGSSGGAVAVEDIIRSVHNEQACADLCSQLSPANSGYGCLGFTTSPGVTNPFGYTPTHCVLIIGAAQDGGATIPCERWLRCCTLVGSSQPPTPSPTRHAYCPAEYADYGVRFNIGMGRITVVNGHAACAARCTQYADNRYSGGCKGYMSGMYFGMVFCRSYGGNYRTMPCAPWAVPWHKGVFSGEVGTIDPLSGQRNIGGNCCTRTSSVVELMNQTGVNPYSAGVNPYSK